MKLKVWASRNIRVGNPITIVQLWKLKPLKIEKRSGEVFYEGTTNVANFETSELYLEEGECIELEFELSLRDQ